MNDFERGVYTDEEEEEKGEKPKRMMEKWRLTSCLAKHSFVCKRSGKSHPINLFNL